ncbi:hypothetical protein Cgig2_026866 [Carnegiea gigantea]|uniref:RNase H type-1 domain-containing protein n=1 Tax=Carnegiea gigantea TaxID=171969 RepID=A0A9Q1KWV7_9CARY|nr:hypothetical protein Cgig2_026866 [Carnegiea gigantea]
MRYWNAPSNPSMGREPNEQSITPDRHLQTLAKRATEFVKGYREVKIKVEPATIPHPVFWSPPTPGLYKLNLMRGRLENQAGAEDVVLAGTEQVHGFTEPVLEEALACLLGLRRAMAAGIDNVVVEGDCLPLIQALGRNKIQDSFMGFIIQDILSIACSFRFCSWSFVKRGGNRVAHKLVHLQPYSFCLRIWEVEVPDSIAERASEDMYLFLNSNIE